MGMSRSARGGADLLPGADLLGGRRSLGDEKRIRQGEKAVWAGSVKAEGHIF